MTYEPRWYQSEAVEAPFLYWAKAPAGGSPCIEVPTGGGKSAIIGWTARRLVEEYGCRVVVATHRAELIEQDAADMREVWPGAPIGIYSSGLNRREASTDVVICGVQSMVRNAKKLSHRDVMIVDEAHLVNADEGTQYRRLVDTLRETNPDMRLLGYTATPFRLGQGYVTSGEGALFTSIPYRVDVKRLIAEGYLSPIVTGYVTANIDITDVATRAGEFVARDLELAANIDSVNEHVADDVTEALRTRKLALVYGVSVAHAAMLRNALQMRGVSCEMITGDMDRPQRREIIKAFKAGTIRCITSCDVLTTGFNVPAVDVIAIVRPTQSTALYVQIVGRGMRTADGKTDCLLLDYGANIARHGPIDSVRVREASSRKGEGDAPVKSCPSCFAEVPTGVRACPHCDYEFPPPERKANAKASNLPALSVKIPAKRTSHEVGSVGVWRHEKKSGTGPPTVRIDYFEPTDSGNVGSKIASEWLCFDHDQGGFAYRKAVDWWVANVGTRLPDSVHDAVARLRTKEFPKVMRVVIEPDGEFTRVVKVVQEPPREPGADDDHEPDVAMAPVDGGAFFGEERPATWAPPTPFDDDDLPF